MSCKGGLVGERYGTLAVAGGCRILLTIVGEASSNGAVIDAGTTPGFFGTCTGLALTASRFWDSYRALANSVLRSSMALAAANFFAFFADFVEGESFNADDLAMISFVTSLTVFNKNKIKQRSIFFVLLFKSFATEDAQ